MRTLTALLLLACLAWNQAWAAGCPMAQESHGQAGADESASPGSHHAHPAPAAAGDHGGGHPQPGHPHAPAQQLAGGCGVLMACGAMAAPSAPLAHPAPDLPRPDGAGAERGAYASPALTADPPPPRNALPA